MKGFENKIIFDFLENQKYTLNAYSSSDNCEVLSLKDMNDDSIILSTIIQNFFIANHGKLSHNGYQYQYDRIYGIMRLNTKGSNKIPRPDRNPKKTWTVRKIIEGIT